MITITQTNNGYKVEGHGIVEYFHVSRYLRAYAHVRALAPNGNWRYIDMRG